MRRNLGFLTCAICALMLGLPQASYAVRVAPNLDAKDEPDNLAGELPSPKSLEELQEIGKSDPVTGKRGGDGGAYEGVNSETKRKSTGKKRDALSDVVDEDDDENDMALRIRRDAQREAAISFGARGGLAWRSKEIMERLEQNKAGLDKVYDFRRLLIKAPSNMYIEPPIISEALNNFVVTHDGGEAAVADTIYHISRQARIVSSPRNWRQYLERDWKEILPPPDILLPESAKERENWRRWTQAGWEEGIKQADEIFQADLNRLAADFEGMVRYRQLLAQNKVSAPYATMEDRGVSGKDVETRIGNKDVKVTTEMRVGDRAIRITSPATLRADTQGQQWDPPIQAIQ